MTVRRVSLTVLMLAVAASLAACSAAAQTPATAQLANPDVVVAAVPATGATGLYIAQQKGFFTAAGLHVTIKSSDSAADTMQDLLEGSVNITLGQWTSAIGVQASGKHLRAVAAGNNGGPALEVLATLAGSPITKLSELAGKKVAVNALDGLSQLLVESLLSTVGVPASKLHWVISPFPLMGEALATHRADAAFMVEPYLSQASEMQGVTELADLDQGPTADFPITGYFATDAWAAKNPATLQAFTTALEQGQELAATDRADVEQALMQFVHITRSTAAVMALGAFPIGVDPVQLERVADLMQTYGLLPRVANVDSIVGAMTGS
jgi:NitT/TauT family transport system substrate-binding protein